MLDEQKIKLMTKLAFYEKREGKEDFKISEYYRKDYVSLHVICSILCLPGGASGPGRSGFPDEQDVRGTDHHHGTCRGGGIFRAGDHLRGGDQSCV